MHHTQLNADQLCLSSKLDRAYKCNTEPQNEKKNYDKIVILYVNNFVDLFYIVCLITSNCSCFDEWFRVARICIRFSKIKVIKTKNSGNCRQP